MRERKRERSRDKVRGSRGNIYRERDRGKWKEWDRERER
jgi:hypothetical protein